MDDVQAPGKATKPNRPAAEINLEDFTTLVARMNRLLVALPKLPVFKSSTIGLAEWMALSILRSDKEIGNGRLAKILGVTEQRAMKIGASLAKAKLVSTKASGTEKAKNLIAITAAGRQKLATVDAALKAHFTSSLKDRERVLGSTSRQLKVVMRVLPEKKRKQDKKPAAEAA